MFGLGRLALTAVVLSVPVLAASASGWAPGDLDASFGDGGHALVSVGTFGAVANAVAVQPDGKILLAGSTIGGPPPPSRAHAPGGDDNIDFVLVRLDPDGTPAPTSGTAAAAPTRTDPTPEGYDQASAIALGSDGSIVLAGSAETTGGVHDFAFVRYTPTGALDPTFSDDGIRTIDLDGDDVVSGVAVQPADEKVVAVGGSGLP